MNVSGHRMGTAEIESALVSHPKVAEAAVVGYPHEVKGEGIYAYVTLNSDVNVSKDLHIELINWVKKKLALLQNLIIFNGRQVCLKHVLVKL